MTDDVTECVAEYSCSLQPSINLHVQVGFSNFGADVLLRGRGWSLGKPWGVIIYGGKFELEME